jgi:hypothetical protein
MTLLSYSFSEAHKQLNKLTMIYEFRLGQYVIGELYYETIERLNDRTIVSYSG